MDNYIETVLIVIRHSGVKFGLQSYTSLNNLLNNITISDQTRQCKVLITYKHVTSNALQILRGKDNKDEKFMF